MPVIFTASQNSSLSVVLEEAPRDSSLYGPRSRNLHAAFRLFIKHLLMTLSAAFTAAVDRDSDGQLTRVSGGKEDHIWLAKDLDVTRLLASATRTSL